MSDHERVERAGLLEGPLDEATVREWPQWARVHAAGCPVCRALLRADETLRVAGTRLRPVPGTPPPAFPGLEALRKRRSRMPALPPAHLLLARRDRFPSRQFRKEGGALALVRTEAGLRAWHADARCILVFALPQAGAPALLHRVVAEDPGVGLDLRCAPADGTVMAAVAAREELDPHLWQQWLADAAASGDPAAAMARNGSDYVHLATFVARSTRGERTFQVRREPVGVPHLLVVPLLQAAVLTEGSNPIRAASLWRQALEEAFTQGDDAGEARAAVGLARCVEALGFREDATAVLEQLARRAPLDPFHAAVVCRSLASWAVEAADLDRAEAWLARAGQLGVPPGGWPALVRLRVADLLGDAAAALAAVATVDPGGLAPETARLVEVRAARALARSGVPMEAARRLASSSVPGEQSLEVLAGQHLARLALPQVDVTWAAVRDEVVACLRDRPDATLRPGEDIALLELVEAALGAGEASVAAELFRLRFLPPDTALDPTVPLLAVAAFRGRVLALDGRRLRRLGADVDHFRQLVTYASGRLLKGSLAGVVSLATLLMPDGVPAGAVLRVASDGLLDVAPSGLLAWCAEGLGGPPPAVRDLVLPWRRDRLPSASRVDRSVASLADPDGSLPFGAAEVLPHEARVFLRGHKVTRAAVQLEVPVGLLHLAVHTRREQGTPELVLADGPVSAVDLLGLRLAGAPVVLLAGCATGQGSGTVGRSLVDGFLRAGASGVVATRWPVRDDQFYLFARRLVEAWPFADLPGVVAQICAELREQGVPPAVWAAPVVY